MPYDPVKIPLDQKICALSLLPMSVLVIRMPSRPPPAPTTTPRQPARMRAAAMTPPWTQTLTSVWTPTMAPKTSLHQLNIVFDWEPLPQGWITNATKHGLQVARPENPAKNTLRVVPNSCIIQKGDKFLWKSVRDDLQQEKPCKPSLTKVVVDWGNLRAHFQDDKPSHFSAL